MSAWSDSRPPPDALLAGELQPVNVVAEARLGRRVAPSTTVRWTRTGVLVNGLRIRLAAVRCGCWMTTREAFDEFLKAQADAARAPPPPATERDPGTEAALRERRLLG